ncbi:hypothetical protein DPMN_012359, partial [Dreissena polymorpha]
TCVNAIKLEVKRNVELKLQTEKEQQLKKLQKQVDRLSSDNHLVDGPTDRPTDRPT